VENPTIPRRLKDGQNVENPGIPGRLKEVRNVEYQPKG
jgi:hypothetical protein